MNAQNRKSISEHVSSLEQLMYDTETLRDEEQEKYDNLSEGLQASENGQAIQTAVDALESALSSLSEAKDYLEEAGQ